MRTTYTYKQIAGLEIQADVYRPDDSTPRPVLVWIHGGALILGHRQSVPSDLLHHSEAKGYVVVSLDYRLAPEVKLPAIIEDLQDALKWVRTEGPALFQADSSRLVVSGGSAGGYLAMMSGICAAALPDAIIAYWGYGDVDGPWYTTPSAHYREMPLVERDHALAQVGHGVLTHVDPSAPYARSDYYLYLRQNGLWTKEVTGLDPEQSEQLNPYCPVRNITPDYPAILMIHGTVDTDVPYGRSADMADELSRHGVRHTLVTVPDAGHGLSEGDERTVREARAAALLFLDEFLG